MCVDKHGYKNTTCLVVYLKHKWRIITLSIVVSLHTFTQAIRIGDGKKNERTKCLST